MDGLRKNMRRFYDDVFYYSKATFESAISLWKETKLISLPISALLYLSAAILGAISTWFIIGSSFADIFHLFSASMLGTSPLSSALNFAANGTGWVAFSSFITFTQSYLLFPMLFASLVLIQGGQWQGTNVSLHDTFNVLKNNWIKILLINIAVVLLSGIFGVFNWILQLISSLSLMFFSWIPYATAAIFYLFLVLRALMTVLIHFLTQSILIFAYCGYITDGAWGYPLLLKLIQVIWTGRPVLFYKLIGLLAAWVAIIIVSIVFATPLLIWLGVPWVLFNIVAIIAYTVLITVSSAYLIVAYRQESDKSSL